MADASQIEAEMLPATPLPGGVGRIVLKALGCSLLVAGLCYLACLQVAPRFHSEARISVGSQAPRQSAASQLQVLRSPDLVRTVAGQLRLETRPEFDSVLEGPSLIGNVMATLGIGRDPLRLSPEERVQEAFARRLTISGTGRPDVISIGFWSEDRNLAAAAANGVAEAFLALRASSSSSGGGIIQRAEAADMPYFPQPLLFAALAGLLAFCATLLFLLFRARRMLQRQADFEAPLPIVPGAVPVDARMRSSDGAPARRATPDEPTLATVDRANRESLATILAEVTASSPKRVMVTLAEGSERGRPPAAVAIARALASPDQRCVLVDLRADGENSLSMGEKADLPGFAHLYAGLASFAQVIFRDRHSRVHFIPGGRKLLQQSELSDERARNLLKALDHTYDHVVLDVADEAIDAVAEGCELAVVVSEFPSADPRTARAFDRITAASDATIMLLAVDPSPARAAMPQAERPVAGLAA